MRNERDMLYNATPQNGFAAPRDYRAPTPPKGETNMLRMGLIAGGITVVVLAALSLWSWSGHKHAGVPVVEADGRPMREHPLDQGGMKVDGANEAILSGGTEGKSAVMPGPEAPALAALHAATSPTVAAPSAPSSGDQVRVAGLAEVPSRPLLNASPTPDEAASRTGSTAVAPATHAPAAASATPPVAAAQPVAKPAAPVATKNAAPATGSALVQLAAVKSEAAANAEWHRLAKKYPGLLGGREFSIVHVDHDGTRFWRLRVVGFADRKAAAEFCARLKSAGGQCALAIG